MWPLTVSLLKRTLSQLFYFKLFIYLTVSSRITNAVLPEYCLRPLNTSDCNLKPTLVFSYYKPGSRCEIKSWKGCPTLNKFKDEYECTNMCIGRLWDNVLQESNRDGTEDRNDGHVDFCNENLNTSKCSNIETTVFSYNLKNEACTSTKYYGCGGNNIFESMESCKKVCGEKNELNALSVSEVEKLTALISNLSVDPDTVLSKSEKSEADQLDQEESNVEKDKNNVEISENSGKTESITTSSITNNNIQLQKLNQTTAGYTNSFASNTDNDLASTTYITSKAGNDFASTIYITSNAGNNLASTTSNTANNTASITYTTSTAGNNLASITSNTGNNLASTTYTTSNADNNLALTTSNTGDNLASTTSNTVNNLASTTYTTSNGSNNLASTTYTTSTDKMYSKMSEQDSTTSTEFTTIISTVTSKPPDILADEIIFEQDLSGSKGNISKIV